MTYQIEIGIDLNKITNKLINDDDINFNPILDENL